MKRLAFLAALLLALPADAGMTTGVISAQGGAYTGPGNIDSNWAFWAGLRAYSAATAGTKAANICNSGDANCADVNTLANGNFDVATAQGSPLNCGGAGGTCTVKTLYDKSGGAYGDYTQATAANRATLTFSCTGLGAGKPCMTFTTSQTYATGGFSSTAQPLTAVAGVKQTSNNTISAPIAADGQGGTGVLISSADNLLRCSGSGTSFDVTATDGTWFAAQCVDPSNGASASTMVLNGSTTSGTLGSGGISGHSLNIGNNFAGTLVEVGINSTAFSSTTYGSMNSNIRNYWGF